mgnify:FL=1
MNFNFPFGSSQNPFDNLLKNIQQEVLFAKTDQSAKAVQNFLQEVREGAPEVYFHPDGFVRIGELAFRPAPNDQWVVQSPLGKQFVENSVWMASAIQMVRVSLQVGKAMEAMQKKDEELAKKASLN